MHPSEPPETAPQPSPTVPAQPQSPPEKPRNRRLRLWLALTAGILTLLCLGTAGVVISLYDDATKIERQEPDAVVDSYLRAYLVNRDEQATALYICKSGGDFGQIAAYRSDIENTEKQFTIGVRVSWTSFDVNAADGTTTVSTEVIRTLSDNSERDSQRWQFAMVDQSGWRVCGATKQA